MNHDEVPAVDSPPVPAVLTPDPSPVGKDSANSVPEEWTEDLTDTEIREVNKLLENEFGGTE